MMLALPYVSGSECITTLERMGFRVHRRARAVATLQRRGDCVLVPESATLSPALIAAILRSANVDALDFIRMLERDRDTSGGGTSFVA
jgi:predicted RNA binding protein YcfA (HicA-like mRNA interferase family)